MVQPVAPRITDSHFHKTTKEEGIRIMQSALESGRMTERDVARIREFLGELRSFKNISVARSNKIIASLISIRRFIGPFEENTIADLVAGIEAIKQGISKRGLPYKANTISDFVVIIKQFYVWLIENGYSGIPEAKLRKIKVPPRDTMTRVASDLLSPEEITAMVRACTRSSDRALVMLLYEGGFRIGEVCTLRWRNLTFDQYGVIVNINFKTMKPRYIRIIAAREYLAQTRADYPGTAEGEALVFLNNWGRPLTHESVVKRLRTIALRAGITRHFTPHIFRHSRITHLIREGLSESVIKLMMWGSVNTTQFTTYAHLTGGDIDAALLERYGIAKDDAARAPVKRFEPVLCPHCRQINPPMSPFCALCGRSLTEDAAADEDAIQKYLAEHPEVMMEYLEEQIRKRAAANGTSISGA